MNALKVMILGLGATAFLFSACTKPEEAPQLTING